eukprot:2628268-Pyramimonas_sp.AAC.1
MSLKGARAASPSHQAGAKLCAPISASGVGSRLRARWSRPLGARRSASRARCPTAKWRPS